MMLETTKAEEMVDLMDFEKVIWLVSMMVLCLDYCWVELMGQLMEYEKEEYSAGLMGHLMGGLSVVS